MLENNFSYRYKKVITMRSVTEMTNLSERQVRYYEEKKLIFPERTALGTRKYSFFDIELLIDIAEKIKDGLQIDDIRTKLMKHENQVEKMKIIQG
ncbi:MAG: MerR family transcriptional regulator [Bacillota bacterium]